MFGFRREPSSLPYQRIALGLGAVALAVFAVVWILFNQKEAPRATHVTPSVVFESDAERDRLTMMNILNRYHARESQLQMAGKKGTAANQSERVNGVEQELRALTVDDSLTQVRERLIVTVDLWQERLSAGSDLQPVRDQFIDLGAEYDWLNTLVWLIVLNHLP